MTKKRQAHTHTGRVMKHGSRKQKQSPWNMSFAAGICWHAYRLSVYICVCVFPLWLYIWAVTLHFPYRRCNADNSTVCLCSVYVCVCVSEKAKLCVMLKEMDSQCHHTSESVQTTIWPKYTHSVSVPVYIDAAQTHRVRHNIRKQKRSQVWALQMSCQEVKMSPGKTLSTPRTLDYKKSVPDTKTKTQHWLCFIWIIQWCSTGLQCCWNMDTKSKHRKSKIPATTWLTCKNQSISAIRLFL